VAECALLAFLLLTAARSDAQSRIKQVLVLQSLDRGNLQMDEFTGEFRVMLDQLAAEPVNVVQVLVGPTGSVGAPKQAVVDYIRSLYANRTAPDLIMTVGGPAAAFAREYRRQLFPGSPLLFASVDQRWLGSAPLGENETAVAVLSDFPQLIDDVLRVRPETRQVFMVVGAGSIGQFWRRQLETGFSRFQGRVTFVWSDELSLPDILRRVANLPSHSAIVWISFASDAEGGAYADAQVLAGLRAKANAPLFGMLSTYLGNGIVGGRLLSNDELSRRTSEVASRILKGDPPSSLRVAPQLATEPMFDWRELERWGIPERRLPAGSVVKYRGATLWEEHKVAVLTATCAFVLQTFLITLLLFERRARQHAEKDSRRNLALAADANRRETISALTTSMGHELAQPLSAIVNNARALQRMVSGKGVTADTTAEILADIHSEAMLATEIMARHRAMLRGHQLQTKPIDLNPVIDDTLALVAHDMRARGIEARRDLSSAPCSIEGDQVLLEQVFINLVRNAMDAVAETPQGKRRITIRSAVSAADVQVSVGDTGPGLPAEVIGTLFTPFVTTKAHGLGIGLTIAQQIVEAHNGTITAHANADGGATFTVSLPRHAVSGRERLASRLRLPEHEITRSSTAATGRRTPV